MVENLLSNSLKILYQRERGEFCQEVIGQYSLHILRQRDHDEFWHEQFSP